MKFHIAETKDEASLLEMVREKGDSDALSVLIGKHQGIVADVMRSYGRRAQITGTLLDDLLSDIPMVVFEAAKKYNPDIKKTKFSTWLWDASKFYTFNFLRKEGKSWHAKSQDSEQILINEGADDSALNENELHGRQMRFVLGELEKCSDERVKRLFKMRYLNASGIKMTFAELAKRLDLSCQGACFLHDKFVRACKKKLEDSQKEVDNA